MCIRDCNTPLFSVNHTFESRVFDVPNPFFAALGQCASSPGAPGASPLVDCPDKAEQPSKVNDVMAMNRNMTELITLASGEILGIPRHQGKSPEGLPGVSS